jgi:hypothetical protein
MSSRYTNVSAYRNSRRSAEFFRFSNEHNAQVLLVDLAADDVCARALLGAGAVSVCMQCAESSALSAKFIALFKRELPASNCPSSSAMLSAPSATTASPASDGPDRFPHEISHFDDERAAELRMVEGSMDLALLPRANAIAGKFIRTTENGPLEIALTVPQPSQSSQRCNSPWTRFTWQASCPRCVGVSVRQ